MKSIFDKDYKNYLKYLLKHNPKFTSRAFVYFDDSVIECVEIPLSKQEFKMKLRKKREIGAVCTAHRFDNEQIIPHKLTISVFKHYNDFSVQYDYIVTADN
ncbi:MAG: hypothetical protein J6S23_02670 [Clostridia bacterium]|nr:hypothetical protein [Clostridia bacterium]